MVASSPSYPTFGSPRRTGQCPIAEFRHSRSDHETARQSGTWTNTDMSALYEGRP